MGHVGQHLGVTRRVEVLAHQRVDAVTERPIADIGQLCGRQVGDRLNVAGFDLTPQVAHENPVVLGFLAAPLRVVRAKVLQCHVVDVGRDLARAELRVQILFLLVDVAGLALDGQGRGQRVVAVGAGLDGLRQLVGHFRAQLIAHAGQEVAGTGRLVVVNQMADNTRVGLAQLLLHELVAQRILEPQAVRDLAQLLLLRGNGLPVDCVVGASHRVVGSRCRVAAGLCASHAGVNRVLVALLAGVFIDRRQRCVEALRGNLFKHLLLARVLDVVADRLRHILQGLYRGLASVDRVSALHVQIAAVRVVQQVGGLLHQVGVVTFDRSLVDCGLVLRRQLAEVGTGALQGLPQVLHAGRTRCGITESQTADIRCRCTGRLHARCWTKNRNAGHGQPPAQVGMRPPPCCHRYQLSATDEAPPSRLVKESMPGLISPATDRSTAAPAR